MKAATTVKVETPETPEISIHAAREGGDNNPVTKDIPFKISIHAAREGGDAVFDIRRSVNLHFNPRRP